jgi:hypothetical protein
MFRPERCPYTQCAAHFQPAPSFSIRYGSYHPHCRPHPIPRFRCRACRRTFFLVATAVGPLRRKGRMTPQQRRRRAAHEDLHGRRPSQSPQAVRRVLQCLRRLAPGEVRLESNHKPLYDRLGRSLFGERFLWRPHDATARRDRGNPLFPINHTNARLRHFLSRLRRRTWCVSKSRHWLQAHLQIAALWVNYCRGITNRTRVTPAQALGIVPRPLRTEEVLAWRQDWGLLSPSLAF